MVMTENGSPIVPPEYASKIIDLIKDFSVAEKVLPHITMARETLQVPLATNGVTAYWVSEGGAITESAVTLSSVTLTAKKIAALTTITKEYLADAVSNPSIAQEIITQMAKAIANEIDRVILVGDSGGSDPFDGLLTLAGQTVTGATSGEITFDDLIDAIEKLEEKGYNAVQDAVFFVNPADKAKLRKLKDNNGNYIWQPSVVAGEPDRILGIPVITAAHLTAGNILLVAKPVALIGDRQDIEVSQSEDRYFEKDLVGIKMVARKAFAVADENAIIKIVPGA